MAPNAVDYFHNPIAAYSSAVDPKELFLCVDRIMQPQPNLMKRQRYSSSSPLGKPSASDLRMQRDWSPQQHTSQQLYQYNKSTRNNTRNSPSPNFKKCVLSRELVHPVRRHKSLSVSSSDAATASLNMSSAMTCEELETSMTTIKISNDTHHNTAPPLTCAEIEQLQMHSTDKEADGSIACDDIGKEILAELSRRSDTSDDSGIKSCEPNDSASVTESLIDLLLEAADEDRDSITSDNSDSSIDSLLSPITICNSPAEVQEVLNSFQKIDMSRDIKHQEGKNSIQKIDMSRDIKNQEGKNSFQKIAISLDMRHQESKMKKVLLPLFNKTQESDAAVLESPKLLIKAPSYTSSPKNTASSSNASKPCVTLMPSVSGNMQKANSIAMDCIKQNNQIKTTIVYNSTKFEDSLESEENEADTTVMPVSSIEAPSCVTLPSPPNAWRRSHSPSVDITHHFAQLLTGAVRVH